MTGESRTLSCEMFVEDGHFFKPQVYAMSCHASDMVIHHIAAVVRRSEVDPDSFEDVQA